MSNSRFRQLRVKSFRGLSLIEVCVAIAIMAIILVSLSGIFNQGYRFLRKTRMNHLACLLAQEQMENLTHEYIFPSPGSFNNVENLGDFTRQVILICPAAQGSDPAVNATLAEISVTVSWQGQSGVQSFTLTSMVSNLAH
ncbi:MAG: prepilin-type N-terminal cleavage/methylation domain-containing protein [Candidatus Omnitrophica bacterium]|nr:prepilin-type N-terminal cleavage/methylation domain-containing protein [Candidatus Omnitrophota bacterium]